MTRRRAQPCGLVLTAASLVLAPLMNARADDKNDCIAAADKGQVLRDKKSLLAAREQFLACARESCPTLVRKQCAEWESAVEASLPSVVISVTANQHEISAARVYLDDQLLLEKLDGEAVAVDPGAHRLRVEVAGASPLEQSLVAHEGEKNQKVAVAVALSKTSDTGTPAGDAEGKPPETPGEKPGEKPAAKPVRGMPTPAVEASIPLGVMAWSSFLRGGSVSAMVDTELAVSYRWSPLFDLGLFVSGAGGGVQLNGDVATAAGVKDQALWGFGLLGVRGRLHWLRDDRLDAWVGLEIAGEGESWSFNGVTSDKDFKFVGSGIAGGLLLGADFPISRLWAVGGDLRMLGASAPHGTRVSCNANCTGDLPGDVSSVRGALGLEARVTLSLP